MAKLVSAPLVQVQTPELARVAVHLDLLLSSTVDHLIPVTRDDFQLHDELTAAASNNLL